MGAITDINQLREVKRRAEIELTDAIRKIVDKFEKESGWSVFEIRVDMMDVTEFSNTDRHNVVSDTKIILSDILNKNG